MNNHPLKIGITGGIGAGKSIVCKIFNVLGVPVYDADTRAKWVMSNNNQLKNQLIEAFGEDVYLDNSGLNRAFLSKLVFNNNEKLALLNSIVHPIVAEDFSNWVKSNLQHPFIVKEAALLFETESYLQLDEVILVTAPTELRIARIKSRDPQRSESEIKAIIDKQMSEEEKIKLASHIIVNDESELVTSQVMNLYSKFSDTNFSRRSE
jgi:dephospho-CoA kinase